MIFRPRVSPSIVNRLNAWLKQTIEAVKNQFPEHPVHEAGLRQLRWQREQVESHPWNVYRDAKRAEAKAQRQARKIQRRRACLARWAA